MAKLTFWHKKEDLVNIYKECCLIHRIPFNPKDFFKYYPIEDEDKIPFSPGRYTRPEFIKFWLPKQEIVLAEIEKIYRPFPEGDIIIGLFPNTDVLYKIWDYFKENKSSWEDPCSHTFIDESKEKVYIILLPLHLDCVTIPRPKALIHELFHANDMLAFRERSIGRVSPEKHQYIIDQSGKITKKYFHPI